MRKDFIAGGFFLVARKIKDSAIWERDPLYLKLWSFLLCKANHTNVTKGGMKYRRGEVVTSYPEIIDALKYRERGRRVRPSEKKVRVMIDWFINQGMIEKTPLTATMSQPYRNQKGDLGAQRGAYVGIRIIVINYDHYQNPDNYKGAPKDTRRGTRRAHVGHDNKNDKNENIKPPMGKNSSFDQFWKTYPSRYPAANDDKKKTEAKFNRLPASDVPRVLTATKNYSEWRTTEISSSMSEPKFTMMQRKFLDRGQWEQWLEPRVTEAGKDDDPHEYLKRRTIYE